MKPIEHLRVAVFRAVDKLHGDKPPAGAGQVVVSREYPPKACADEEPFYMVSVIGVWPKSHHWMDYKLDGLLERVTEEVREMTDAHP